MINFIRLFSSYIGNRKTFTFRGFNDQELNQNYKLIKVIKTQNVDSVNNVALYESKSGERVVVKGLRYSFKDIFYRQLYREIDNNRVLREIAAQIKNPNNVVFPKIIMVRQSKDYVFYIQEYSRGKLLSELLINTQLMILDSCLNYLIDIGSNLSPTQKKRIPKRPNHYIFITFPIIFFAALLKTKKDFIQNLRLFIKFYFYFQYRDLFKTDYTLNHRDLHMGNILVSGNKIAVLDPAIMAFAQRETDLAILSRYYVNSKNLGDYLAFLTTHLKTDKSKYHFTYLSIYYTYQALILEQYSNPLYQKAKLYLKYLDQNFSSQFIGNHNL